jgi:hypothetical protein
MQKNIMCGFAILFNRDSYIHRDGKNGERRTEEITLLGLFLFLPFLFSFIDSILDTLYCFRGVLGLSIGRISHSFYLLFGVSGVNRGRRNGG